MLQKQRYNGEIFKGFDWSLLITFPYDITNLTYTCSVKDLDLVSSITATIVKDNGNKQVQIKLTDTQTNTLTAGKKYRYILKQTDTNNIDLPIIFGDLDVIGW